MFTVSATSQTIEPSALICVIGLCNCCDNSGFGNPQKILCCKKPTFLARYAIARTFGWPAKSSDVIGCPLIKQPENPKITEKNPDFYGSIEVSLGHCWNLVDSPYAADS